MPPSGCLYLVCSARLPPLAPPAVKGCLHGCEVSISTVPSPDATCFYYNRLVPLVLIKYSECSRQSIHPRRQLSVLLFSPSLPLHVASSLPSSNLSQLVSRARMRACVRACAIRTDAFFWFCCFYHQCHTWQLSYPNSST